jgi:hypothetical protein
MRKQQKKTPYDADFYKWTLVQAKLLKNQEFDKVDIENIIEEIESLGRSQRDKLQSHLEVYFMHLLKWQYQSNNRSKSWELSIKNSKMKAKQALQENPSLKSKLESLANKAYSYARRDAAIETEIDIKNFPKECPWDIRELMK